MRKTVYSLLLLPLLNGCAVVAVADAAVSIGATAVKAGATVVGAAVGVTASVAKKVTGTNNEDK
ncbi:MAG: hypothetical protein WC091_13450 [Sulfuricellaceae bacterium]